MKNFISILTFILAFALTANAQLGIPSSYKDTTIVGDSAKMIWQIGPPWVPAKLRSQKMANLKAEIGGGGSGCPTGGDCTFNSVSVTDSLSLSGTNIASTGPETGASKIGTITQSGFWNKATFFGTSYCNGDWAIRFAVLHSFRYNSLCVGGSKVGDSTQWGRVYSTTFTDTSTTFMDVMTNDVAASTDTSDISKTLTAMAAWAGTTTPTRYYDTSATYYGTWTRDSVSGVKYRMTTTANDSAVFTFTGSSFVLGSLIDTAGGGMQVFVDGVNIRTISNDRVGAGYRTSAAYIFTGFTSGSHTVRLVASGAGRRFFSWWTVGTPYIRSAPRVFIAGTTAFPDFPLPAQVAPYNAVQNSVAASLQAVGIDVSRVPYSIPLPLFRDTYHLDVAGQLMVVDSVWNVYKRLTVQQAVTAFSQVGGILPSVDPTYKGELRGDSIAVSGTIYNNQFIVRNGRVAVGANSFPTEGSLLVIGGTDASSGVTVTDNVSNATLKQGFITVPHYTNAEERVGVLFCQMTSTVNVCTIGGNSQLNSLTRLLVRVAANNTTLSGTSVFDLMLSRTAIRTDTTKFGSDTSVVISSKNNLFSAPFDTTAWALVKGTRAPTNVFFGDSNFTMTALQEVAQTAAGSVFTTPHVLTLASAALVQAGREVCVIDAGGRMNVTGTVAVTPAGANTIDGIASPVVINAAYSGLCLISNGSTGWTRKP